MHIVSDVSDRDRDDEPPRVLGIGIVCRMHGVIVILGIRRIDCDQREVAPILPSRNRRGRSRLRLLQRRCWKNVRNGMGMDRNQAYGSLARKRA